MKSTTILIVLVAVLAVLFPTGCSDESGPTDACDLAPDPGPCEAYIPKYFYDAATGECADFVWGGCDGTVPFDSLGACEAACE
jgi:hypothetical protein